MHEVTSQQDQNKNQLPVTSGLCPRPLFRQLISVRIRPDNKKPKQTKLTGVAFFSWLISLFTFSGFCSFSILFSQSVKNQSYQLYVFDNRYCIHSFSQQNPILKVFERMFNTHALTSKTKPKNISKRAQLLLPKTTSCGRHDFQGSYLPLEESLS